MGILSAIGKGLFGESTAAKATRIASEDPFKIKLARDFFTLDSGGKIEVLSVKVRGTINSGIHHSPTGSASLSVRLSTEGTAGDEPVICAIERLQASNSPAFQFISDSLDVHYGVCGGWTGWVNLVSVPIESLTFARKGDLKVGVRVVAIFNGLGAAGVQSREASLYYTNSDLGFMDTLEQRERGLEVAVSLAVLVSGVDGSHDNHEAKIVKGFIQKQVAELKDEKERNKTKKSLNDAVIKTHALKAVSLIKRSGLALAREAKDFESSLKFMIMELLLDVAGADSVAHEAETQFLNSLAHTMGMDVDEYKNMRDKALPIAMYRQNSAVGGGQFEDMLGISANMSVPEKKSQLSKEFRKWNPLQNSSDPAKSQQAKDMVKAIAKIRKKL
jgi:hypothetical protein